MNNKILYIEPVNNYDEVIDLLHEQGDIENSDIFIPSIVYRNRFLEILEKKLPNAVNNVLPYSTNNVLFDNELYKNAMKISDVLYKCYKKSSKRHYGEKDSLVVPATEWATKVTFHDRFVGVIRPFFEFNFLLDSSPQYKNIIFVPRIGKTALINFNLLKKLFPTRSVNMLKDHHNEKLKKLYLDEDLPYDIHVAPKIYRTAPLYDKPKRLRKNSICICSQFRDIQYRNTLLAFAGALSKKRKLICINAIKPLDYDFLDDFGINLKSFNILEKSDELIKKDLTEKDTNFITDSVLEFKKRISKTGKYSAYADALSCYVSIYSMNILKYVEETYLMIDKVLNYTSCVVVTPGRMLDSAILVGAAKQRGIPTIEVQSGTISASNRFIKPDADEVLAIDTFSKSVYCDFLKKPKNKVVITGGPKLDFDLKVYRNISQNKARSNIKQILDIKENKIMMLASQPIGVAKMSDIARIAIEAAKEFDDLWLCIKPHPNEYKSYLDSYKKISKELGFDRLKIIEDCNTLELVVASDMVATFYSTVGLESYALNKDVICINPFKQAIPFDLTQVGVAELARNTSQVRKLIKNFISGRHDQREDNKKELYYLRDGKVVERLTDHIVKRSDEYIKDQGFWNRFFG